MEVAGEIRQVAFPGVVPVLGQTSLPVRNVGPDLGADNDYVFRELLGLSDEEVAALGIA